jgi:hypothetical protein
MMMATTATGSHANIEAAATTTTTAVATADTASQWCTQGSAETLGFGDVNK